MARRSRKSPAEEWMELIGRLPWWAGVALALGSYLLLHAYASRPVPAVPPGGAPDAYVGGMVAVFWRGLAGFGQYVVPIVCLGGAAISALGRGRRRALARDARRGGAAAVHAMRWQEFEQLVGEAFRQRGFAVAERGGTGDGGVDLVLRRGGERYLVQCKHWRAATVGVPVVRELYGAMAAEGATGGYVVTSGEFTRDAREFAAGRNVELIGGAQLAALLDAARSSATAVQAPPGAVAPSGANAAPACPRCGEPMVERTARRGASAGSRFWGCARYPACRGVREIGMA